MKCSKDEFKKYYKLVKEKKLTNKVAAKACHYTPEQFSKLRKRFEREGDRIFIHGQQGKPSHNKKFEKVKEFVVQGYLREFDEKTNPISFQYWTDELNEEYGIKISYSTVYNFLTEAGISSPEKHKTKREPVQRIQFRRKNFGELIQWDATPYQWFLWCGDTRYYTLHGALDDSTSRFLALYMTEFECSYGYLECRRQVLENFGIELEDYSDKSPVFSNNSKDALALDKDEQLAGITRKQPLWQKIDDELGIELHLANSPQAKGKIERGWKTVQGRLPALFKKHKIHNIEEANIFLKDVFIDYYEKHFGKTVMGRISVFREIPKELNLDNILCVKERRTVNRHGCISFKNMRIKVIGIERYGIVGELCINEKGLWFLYKGRTYGVEIKNELHNLADSAAQTLENIIYKYMYEEQHFKAA